MKRLLLWSALSLSFSVSSGYATPCTSFPYTLTNGTTADATQVMANYTYLSGCLAPLASPSFTGNASIGTSGTNGSLTVWGPETVEQQVAGGSTAILFTLSGGGANYGPLIYFKSSSAGTYSNTGSFTINANAPANGGNALHFEMGGWGYGYSFGVGSAAGAKVLADVRETGSGASGSTEYGRLRILSSTDAQVGYGSDGLGNGTAAISLDANSANASYINAGLFGIGTASPKAMLEVAVSNGLGYTWTPDVRDVAIFSNAGSPGSTISIPASTTGQSAIYFGNPTVEAMGQIFYDNTANNLALYNAHTQLQIQRYSSGTYPAVTISSASNVGIGTTSPSYLLHVGSSSASGIVAEWQNSGGSCTLNPPTTTLSCSSDARLKKDIVDSGAVLPSLTDMRIRDFTIRKTGERMTGVIAQEMLKHHADMVHMGKDGFYKVDGPNPWILVKAIQEQQAQIEALKSANQHLAADLEQRKTTNDRQERDLLELKKQNASLAVRVNDADTRLDALENRLRTRSASLDSGRHVRTTSVALNERVSSP